MSAAAKENKQARKRHRRRHKANWTFLTNHAHVLLAIASDPERRMREIAQHVGITERAVQRIVADLVEAGYVSRIRSGRRNQYHVDAGQPLKHPLVAHQPLGALMALGKGKKRPIPLSPATRNTAAPASEQGPADGDK